MQLTAKFITSTAVITRPRQRQKPLIHNRSYRVLGIETSCDDTAVAIVDSKRTLISSRKVSDWLSTNKLGGITPLGSAMHHRQNIDRLVNECLNESRLRISDIDAVAASHKPGLIVCLKVGVDKAISLAKDNHIHFIPIHHMRAHSLIARFIDSTIKYPFVTLLISGAHSLICRVDGPNDFLIIGESIHGSPGEVLDKIARLLGLDPAGGHLAASLEKMAERSTDQLGYLRINKIRMPHTPCASDFNFTALRNSLVAYILNNPPKAEDLPDYCLSIQFILMSHLCKRLDFTLDFISKKFEAISNLKRKVLVVSGGVAANKYFLKGIQFTAEIYGFETFAPPPEFCTDNGVMIAWAGIENILAKQSDFVLAPESLPTIWSVQDRAPIGQRINEEIQNHSLPRRFQPRIIHKKILSSGFN